MLIGDLLAAMFVALIASLILGTFMRWERPGRSGMWSSVLFLFSIIFLTTWFIGALLQPFGPVICGVYWIPFFLIGLIVALLLAATIPPPRPRTMREAKVQAQRTYEAKATLDSFFWLFFVVLIVALVIRYTA